MPKISAGTNKDKNKKNLIARRNAEGNRLCNPSDTATSDETAAEENAIVMLGSAGCRNISE